MTAAAERGVTVALIRPSSWRPTSPGEPLSYGSSMFRKPPPGPLDSQLIKFGDLALAG
jgi:hypothetical protein